VREVFYNSLPVAGRFADRGPMPEVARIPLADIEADETIQCRITIDADTVAAYADDIRVGDDFPPVVVFRDPETGVLRLADGFHRYRAHAAAGDELISAEVRDGDYRAARLFAVGANRTNSRQMTRADKRKALDRLLLDKEWSAWSDNHIARKVGVNNHTVKRRREDLGIPKSEEVVYGSGHTMCVANIGGGRQRAPLAEAVAFVARAAAKRDYAPILACLHIGGGRVLAYDGRAAASSPVDTDLRCSADAAQLTEHLKQNGEPTSATLDRDALVLRWEPDRVSRVTTRREPPPNVEPSGDVFDAPADLVEAFKQLQPFTSRDASRPWARGVLLTGSKAYAINGPIIIERETAAEVSVEMRVPAEAVELVLAAEKKLGERPHRVQTDGRTLTLHYRSGRWILADCLPRWTQVEELLVPTDRCNPVPEGFFDSVKRLSRHGECVFFLGGGVVSTTPAPERLNGVQEVVLGVGDWGCFDADRLLLLDGVATAFDLSASQGCPFVGPGVRGAIVRRKWEAAEPLIASDPPPPEPPPPPPAETPCLEKLAALLGVSLMPFGIMIGEHEAEKLVVKLGI
jgi:hypothetical protein